MLVMTGGQDGTMQPMPLVMTELSALMPGTLGPIYRGMYNHAYEYLSIIDNGNTRIYMDFGEGIRDRDVTYVDMSLWNVYRRAAEDHLSNYSLPA